MKKYAIFIFIIMAAVVQFATQTNFILAQAEQEKLITLDVKDMEITDVIRMIADQSGMNIITSKNVKGMVTINLQSIPIEKALDAILKVNNCGYIKDANIIQVYTLPELNQKEQFSQMITKVYRLEFIKVADLKPTLMSLKSGRGRLEAEPKTNTIVVTDIDENLRAIEDAIKEMDKKLETKVYRLNYAKPADLQKNLQAVIPATEGDFLVDERTNSLVVTASPLLMSKIEALVTNWDKQIPQVLIEAKIMEITLEKNKLIGVDWSYQNPAKHSISVGTKGIPLPIPKGTTYVDAFKIGVLGADDYEIAIRALENDSDVNLISSPRIVALENTEAKILIGSSEPYEIFHYDAEGHITGTEVKFVDVGIKLTVTPKISEDGFVTMSIRPEVSSARKGTASDSLAMDTTEANTVMTVKDGNTVVMGGLIKDNKEDHVAKIPILGDIPFIKHAFRTKYTTTTKKEIIIFITPKIISAERAPELGFDGRDREIQDTLMNTRN